MQVWAKCSAGRSNFSNQGFASENALAQPDSRFFFQMKIGAVRGRRIQLILVLDNYHVTERFEIRVLFAGNDIVSRSICDGKHFASFRSYEVNTSMHKALGAHVLLNRRFSRDLN